MAFSLRVRFNANGFKNVIVASSNEEFQKTTIRQLKKKMVTDLLEVNDPNRLRVIFANQELEDDRTLQFYRIQPLSVLIVVIKMPRNAKEYCQLNDDNIELVNTPSDFDPFDKDPNVLRAKLSCGHVTDAETLTECCTEQLKSGNAKLVCPICTENWSYGEVRKLGKLTRGEQFHFEETLGENTAKHLTDVKQCPNCGIFVERTEVDNLCVECLFCTANTGEIYEFCWQCQREWKGPGPRDDRCDNENCLTDMVLLRDCKMIEIEGIQCPSIRACPECGMLFEHTGEMCPNVECISCKQSFCFFCLCNECFCTTVNDVAPRQTSIP